MSLTPASDDQNRANELKRKRDNPSAYDMLHAKPAEVRDNPQTGGLASDRKPNPKTKGE